MLSLSGLRRALWLACACMTLFVPRALAADRALTADFDGDGKNDWVAIDRSEPTIVHVWLSATHSANVIRSPRAVLRVAATDVDGDHRPELIATDASTAGLRIWKTHQRRGFRAYHPWRARPRATGSSNRRAIDDDPPDTAEGLRGSAYPHDSVLTRDPPPPPFCACAILIHRLNRDLASHAFFGSSTPRAPPAFPI
jgi:hypothetical protein